MNTPFASARSLAFPVPSRTPDAPENRLLLPENSLSPLTVWLLARVTTSAGPTLDDAQEVMFEGIENRLVPQVAPAVAPVAMPASFVDWAVVNPW